MAGRTPITPITVVREVLTVVPPPGITPDVTNGNVVTNDGATALVLLSMSSLPRTLTVSLIAGLDGLPIGPRTYVVPVSTSRQIVGPFPVQFYGQQLQFNLDSPSVLVQAVSLAA